MKIIQLTKLNDLMILILFYFIIEQHMEATGQSMHVAPKEWLR